MGLEALPDSATTNQKQEMGHFMRLLLKATRQRERSRLLQLKNDSSRSCRSGYSDHPNYMSHTKSSQAKVKSLSAPDVQRRLKYSNVKQNDDQHCEAIGKPKKASYRETQVSREVVMVPDFSE
ncbi:IQ-DOMAIN 14-like protein [Tanacetum coccineum]